MFVRPAQVQRLHIHHVCLTCTGPEVQSRGPDPGGSLLLWFPDPHGERPLRDVQHAHQHVHPGPATKVAGL